MVLVRFTNRGVLGERRQLFLKRPTEKTYRPRDRKLESMAQSTAQRGQFSKDSHRERMVINFDNHIIVRPEDRATPE